MNVDPGRAVYRECNDQSCKAFRLDLPHSHFEYSETADLATHAMERLRLLDDFSGTLTLSPAATFIEPQFVERTGRTQWMSIPLDDLMQLVGNYITWVETGMTKDVCKCTWIQHPEKGNIRGGDTALDCPAHSKEGLVLGFFTWLTAQPDGLVEHGD